MSNMEKITIIFGTVMGSAEGCALKISERLTACKLENEVIDMEDYDHARLPQEKLLIVATSTTGNGVPPNNALALHSHLTNDKPDVTGITFAVLSLGDSFRALYAQCGKDFDRMLEELGGSRIIDRIDCDGVVEAPLQQFLDNLLNYFEREKDKYPTFVRADPPKESVPERGSSSNNPNPKLQKKSIISRIKRRIIGRIRRFL